MATVARDVFISGGTGYMGRVLVAQLVERGHKVRVLARAGSEGKVPAGASAVRGDALDEESFVTSVPGCDTFVHLTGVAHPAPWKEKEFRAIDFVSLHASARAARAASVGHFVYVSVAQPAPTMKAYIQVRSECEHFLGALRLRSTILRPWYVLGPGHRWPVVLKPLYALLESMPSTRAGARRLGLVTLDQMTAALVWAVENPPPATRILEVPAIRDEPARTQGFSTDSPA
jgi:uncharacterized protein YbjT (DUF2867 family)